MKIYLTSIMIQNKISLSWIFLYLKNNYIVIYRYNDEL